MPIRLLLARAIAAALLALVACGGSASDVDAGVHKTHSLASCSREPLSKDVCIHELAGCSATDKAKECEAIVCPLDVLPAHCIQAYAQCGARPCNDPQTTAYWCCPAGTF